MRTQHPALLGIAAALCTAACVRPMYNWDGYDDSLYHHYKNPQQRETFVENLKTTILDSEQSGLKVPPGIYAEYGFVLYEEGKNNEAIAYFEKEKAKWPESRFIMEKMIRNAQHGGSRTPASTQGPAGALEKTR